MSWSRLWRTSDGFISRATPGLRKAGSSSAAWQTLACGLLALWGVLLGASSLWAQMSIEADPIRYSQQPGNNPVTRLQQELDAGNITLEHDEQHGYLPALLKALRVSRDSQTLVFSQTSLQLRKISPSRPRAIYFNDETYIGWVQTGDVLEVATADPELGALFYTLEQAKTERPRFIRDQGHCLSCHETSRTQNVPGFVVRSVFSDAAGRPLLGSGTFVTDHTSPFEQRWGGWYVSGQHGDMRHMGNVIATGRLGETQLDRERGANLMELPKQFDARRYLTPHSDLIALMILEHQAQMHNFITLANFETRQAWHYNQVMNKALDRPENYRSESTERRVAAVAEKLVHYLFFCEEFQLSAPVRGTSQFAQAFAEPGPRDKRGRSLRQLNLQTRLLEYPCSYLIYSPTFDALPTLAKDEIYRRMVQILTATDERDEFSHLSLEQRRAIREILSDTKPEFAQAMKCFLAEPSQ